MAVTKEILNEYLDEKKEIEELQRRAKNYESKIARIEKAISKTPTENNNKPKNKVPNPYYYPYYMYPNPYMYGNYYKRGSKKRSR